MDRNTQTQTQTQTKNIYKLYHGTSAKNALSILKNGFDLEKAGENWGTTYGKGIYFSPNYETAKFYAGEDGIVLSFNLQINPYELKKDIRPNSKRKIKIPFEFDSIINPNRDEVIVTNKDVFLHSTKK